MTTQDLDLLEHAPCRLKGGAIVTQCSRVELRSNCVGDPFAGPRSRGWKYDKSLREHKRLVLVEHLVWPLHCFEHGTGSRELRPCLQDAKGPHTCSFRTGPKQAEDLILVDVGRVRLLPSLSDNSVHDRRAFGARWHGPPHRFVRAGDPRTAANNVCRTFKHFGRFKIATSPLLVGLLAQAKLEVTEPQ